MMRIQVMQTQSPYQHLATESQRNHERNENPTDLEQKCIILYTKKKHKQ